MSNTVPSRDMTQTAGEIERHLRSLRQFWTERALDSRHGGYRTSFDQHGDPVAEDRKYLLSHTRLVWSFAALADALADDSLLTYARVGYDYLREHFLDQRRGGWFWTVNLDGTPADAAKLTYGQSFAIYALAAYGRISNDPQAVQYAAETFDVLMRHAADSAWGGFYENFDDSWNVASGGSAAGDRKSLDIHMHLLEALTELAIATGSAEHRRRLAEIRTLILCRMVDMEKGFGGNQYTVDFEPLSPIIIDKTWNAERMPDQVGRVSQPTTSYGHNLELGWLLGRADRVLELGDGADAPLIDKLAQHALRYGYDPENGGVYREGPPVGSASDLDKEFWQNAEALVGFLDAYELTGNNDYLTAFEGTWQFARAHLIDAELGEWRVRVARDGAVKDGALGNHWTGAYHTVRSAIEVRRRLSRTSS